MTATYTYAQIYKYIQNIKQLYDGIAKT